MSTAELDLVIKFAVSNSARQREQQIANSHINRGDSGTWIGGEPADGRSTFYAPERYPPRHSGDTFGRR